MCYNINALNQGIILDNVDLDWYTYLTEDFKLDRDFYTVRSRAVVDCPNCGKTSTIRVDNLKAKIKKLGRFECGLCRRRKGAEIAREKKRESEDSL